MSRRDFLVSGGTALAGATPLAGFGGSTAARECHSNLAFSFVPDDAGTLTEIVNRFDQQCQGGMNL